MSFVSRFIPILDSLANYEKRLLVGDISAGLTVCIILIPQGLSYAGVAKLPPVFGLYSGIAPVILYAVFCVCPHLSIGPFAVVSMLVGQCLTSAGFMCLEDALAMNMDVALAQHEQERFVSANFTLMFLVGAVQVFLSFLGGGSIISEILSPPVATAYTSACACFIAMSQINAFAGFSSKPESPHYAKITSTDDQFGLPMAIADVIQNIPKANPCAFAVGMSGLVLILVCKRTVKSLPAELLAVVLGTTACKLFRLDEQFDLQIIREIPTGLPTPTVPNSEFFHHLIGGAMLIGIVGYVVSIAIVKNFVALGANYPVRGDQELFAMGVANLGGSFLHGYTASGSLSRSAALKAAGGETPVSGFVTAGLMIVALLLLMPCFFYLPKAILAAVVFAALESMFRALSTGITLWKSGFKLDALVWLCTLVATLLFGITSGIVYGITFSFTMGLASTNNAMDRIFPDMYTALFGKLPDVKQGGSPDEVMSDSVLQVQFCSPLLFFNSKCFQILVNRRIDQSSSKRVVVILDMSKVLFADKGGIAAIQSLCSKYAYSEVETAADGHGEAEEAFGQVMASASERITRTTRRISTTIMTRASSTMTRASSTTVMTRASRTLDVQPGISDGIELVSKDELATKGTLLAGKDASAGEGVPPSSTLVTDTNDSPSEKRQPASNANPRAATRLFFYSLTDDFLEQLRRADIGELEGPEQNIFKSKEEAEAAAIRWVKEGLMKW